MHLPAPQGTAARLAPAWLSLHFSFVIALSAFLLFQVQPLIGKFILPWFGGGPAVWTTCMLFFQCVLFAGYAYAHASVRFLPPAGQMTLHSALLLLAALLFPVVPDVAFKPVDGSDPTLRIILLLARAVGLPYFMLSTTGPLVQAWFSRVFPDKSPYRLYSLSNIGSFAALLSYPFFFETIWDVRTQSYMWRGAFVVFAVACALAAYSTWRHNLRPATEPTEAKSAPDDAFHWWHPVLWTLLPAWASMVFLATTNHMCQDVAPIPFLWIVPLSLYLLTFIICFDHERWYVRSVFAGTMLVAVLALTGDKLYYFLKESVGHRLHYTEEVALLAAAMFLICMVCHGEIVRLRPHSNHLTLFYMLVSLGGALGGVFVSLIAPQLWGDYYEWYLALYGSLILGIAALAADRIARGGSPRVQIAVAAVCGLVGLGLMKSWMTYPESVILDRARNFYGVSAIEETEIGTPNHHRLMWHGGTAHGRQFVSTDLARRRTPIGYYGPKTGIAKAITHFHSRPNCNVCTIGLGTGTTAAFGREGDHYRFYEINEEVIRQAKELFTYLEDCPAKTDIIPGDARLMLEQEFEKNGSHQFDVICVDAFSGDSVPSHLITTEAMDLYLNHLKNKDEGIICLNIKNRYIDLWPVVRGLAAAHGLQTRRISFESDVDELLYATDFVLLTNNPEFLAKHEDALPEGGNSTKEVPLWRDDFNNLFQILK